MQWFAAFLLGLVSTALAEPTYQRRPDSSWEYVVNGAGIKRRDENTSASIAHYNLRRNSVDPSSLGLDNVKQYAGYLDDTDQDKHLFYWFFESRSDPKNDPLILWLSGGPGCSSALSLFLELGPAKVAADMRLVRNPDSWNSRANLVFLDQPVGTGFSYGKRVDSTAAATKDVFALLRLFFRQFPEYATQDFHIAGESYSGHFIPSLAAQILSDSDSGINLKSIIIGNGMLDPYHQWPQFPEMACGNGDQPVALNNSVCEGMRANVPKCQSAIGKCYDSRLAYDCQHALMACEDVFYPFAESGRSPYDMRIMCQNENGLCHFGNEHVMKYLNQRHVRDALHIDKVSHFESCSDMVFRDFVTTGDAMLPSHENMPGILSSNVSVLVFAGETDYICNWLGQRAWTEALEWPGQLALQAAQPVNLKIDFGGGSTGGGGGDDDGDGGGGGGDVYGTIKHAQGLAVARIFDSGHFVPRDKPGPILDLVKRWIHDKEFQS